MSLERFATARRRTVAPYWLVQEAAVELRNVSCGTQHIIDTRYINYYPPGFESTPYTVSLYGRHSLPSQLHVELLRVGIGPNALR